MLMSEDMTEVCNCNPVSFREFHCDKRVLGLADLYAISKIKQELWLNFMLKELLLIEILCLSYRESLLLREDAEQKHIVSSVNFTALSCDSVNLNGVWFVWA